MPTNPRLYKNKLLNINAFLLFIFLFLAFAKVNVTADEWIVNDAIIMQAQLLTGKDKGPLKAGEEGMVFIRLYNKSDRPVWIPFFSSCETIKGVKIPEKNNKLIENYYAGFEFALMKYSFLDSNGTIIQTSTKPCIIEGIELEDNVVNLLSIPIDTPKIPGKYRFEFIFDNRSLEKLLFCGNLIYPDLKLKRALFHQKIIINDIEIK